MRRKRDALWSAALLLAAVLLLTLAGGYGFSKERVLRTQEAGWGTGETRIVTEAETPMPGIWTLLSANHRAVLMGTVRHQWWTGWQAEGALALDCTGGESIYTGWWQVAGESIGPATEMEGGSLAVGTDTWGERLYLFGRVDDERIERLRFRGEDWQGQAPEAETGREEWFYQNGRTYFLLELEAPEPGNEHFQAVGLDREGQEVARGGLGAEGRQTVSRPRLTDAWKAIWFRL